MKNENKEKCIEIVNAFIENELGKNEKLLFDYCFIKNAYSKSNYFSIKNKYSFLDKYYENLKIPENDIFFEEKNGDGDRIQIVKAIYCLLWEDSKIDLNCEIANNKILKIIGKNEISYSGDTINTRDLIFGINNRMLNNLCRDQNSEYSNLELIAERFRLKYETLGNFMPCPIGELNTCKNNMLGERFDLYLEEIQKFFYKEIEYNITNLKNNDNTYRDKIIKSEYISLEFYNVLKNNIKYFESFENFDNFIKDNYLDDYVTDNKKINRTIWHNKRLDEFDYTDTIKYIKTSTDFINKRAERMEKKLCNILYKYRIKKIIESNKTLKENEKTFRDIIESNKEFGDNDFIDLSGKFYLFKSQKYSNIESTIGEFFQDKMMKYLKDSIYVYIKFNYGREKELSFIEFMDNSNLIIDKIKAKDYKYVVDTTAEKNFIESVENNYYVQLVILMIT